MCNVYNYYLYDIDVNSCASIISFIHSFIFSCIHSLIFFLLLWGRWVFLIFIFCKRKGNLNPNNLDHSKSFWVSLASVLFWLLNNRNPSLNRTKTLATLSFNIRVFLLSFLAILFSFSFTYKFTFLTLFIHSFAYASILDTFIVIFAAVQSSSIRTIYSRLQMLFLFLNK